MNRRILTLVGILGVLAAALPAGCLADNSVQEGATSLFNGRDLSGWKLRGDQKSSKWLVGLCELDVKNATQFSVMPIAPQADGGPAARLLINSGSGVDLISEKEFRDCVVEVEFMIPKGSNSGIYLMGQYEVQVLDSFGKANDKLASSDMGGIYNTAAPKVNACKKPGEWQRFVIDFKAPRFESGKKVANGKFAKVVLNDQVIHENVEVKAATGGELKAGEVAQGPLMIQGDHGPIAIRALRVTAK